MTPQDVEAAVERALDRKLGRFYIDAETHYKDHELIQSLRKWSEEAKGTILKTLLNTLALGCIGLLILGFILWGKDHIGHGP